MGSAVSAELIVFRGFGCGSGFLPVSGHVGSSEDKEKILNSQVQNLLLSVSLLFLLQLVCDQIREQAANQKRISCRFISLVGESEDIMETESVFIDVTGFKIQIKGETMNEQQVFIQQHVTG